MGKQSYYKNWAEKFEAEQIARAAEIELAVEQKRRAECFTDLLKALDQLVLGVTNIRGIDMEDYCMAELDDARMALDKATQAP